MATFKLKSKDLSFLNTFIRTGNHKAQEITRAKILLELHKGKEVEQIEEKLDCSYKTIGRIREKYQKGNLKKALYDAPRSGQPSKFTKKDEATLVSIACTTAPMGNAHWTVDLILEKFNKNRKNKIGRTAIWKKLKTRKIKPWREKNVVYTQGR